MKSDARRADAYHAHERGNRLEPRRSDRNYWHLTLLRDKLQRVIDSGRLPAGETLLDYGCADKPYEELFRAKFKRYVGADIPGNEQAELTLEDGGRIPAGDESFDCVLSSQVLEHVENPQVYLKESLRVMKAGGSLILSTHGIWPYHPDPTDFWRWTLDGLQREICRAGFEVLMVQSVFGLESSALQLWQDATYERLPRPLRAFYTRCLQSVIGFIERRQPEKLSHDASVYVVLARKPGGAEAGESRA